MGACGGKSKPASTKQDESNVNQPKVNQPNSQNQQQNPPAANNPLSGLMGEVVAEDDSNNKNLQPSNQQKNIQILESNAVGGQFDSKQLSSMGNAVNLHFNKDKDKNAAVVDKNNNFESNNLANMEEAWKKNENK